MGRRNDNGGSGGGNDQGGDAAFTEAQQQELSRMINAATSSHHTRMQKVMDQKLADMQSSIGDSFSSVLEEKLSAFGKRDQDQESKGDKQGKGDDEVTRAHNARIAEMEKKLEQERQARMAEAEKAKVAKERSELQSALRKAGVPDERLRSAVALLYTEDRRVASDEDGNIVFTIPRDGYTDRLPLDQGVEEWLKAPEGKHFAPPRDVRGSGAQPGRGTGPNGAKTRQDLKRELVEAVLLSERT